MTTAEGEIVFKKKRGARSAGEPTSSSSSRRLHLVSKDDEEQQQQQQDSSSSSSSSVILKPKRKQFHPLIQATARSSSLKRFKHFHHDDDDEEEEEDSIIHATHSDRFGESSVSSRSKFSGTSTNQNKNKQDATRHNNWDLEHDDGGRNPISVPIPNSSSTTTTPTNDDGIYRGSKNYSSYLETRDDGSSSKMKARGPIKVQTTVRSTALIDYQPDICKDYKETGYCGFGDTCKFLHDRSDYLAGWQLDLVSNSGTKKHREAFSDDEQEEEDEEEEAIPFACLICRNLFNDPVITRCGHYFCSKCAIKRYAKTPKCFACGAQTSGLFHSATKVLEKRQKRKQLVQTESKRKRGYLTQEQEQEEKNDDDDDSLATTGIEILNQ